MIYCITHTQKELALFFVITLVASILFGSAVYYCEQDADSGYISIPGPGERKQAAAFQVGFAAMSGLRDGLGPARLQRACGIPSSP
jgi:hypothetical protein